MTITENPPKAPIETCNHWDTDYISDNWEQHSEHSIKSDNEQHLQFLRSLSCAYHSCFCSVSCPFWCFVFSGAVCDSLPNSSQCAQTRWPRLVPPLNLTMECLAAHSRPPRRSQRYSPRFGQESALMVRVNNQIYTFWRITPPSSFFQQENRTFLFWPPLYGQPHRKKYFWQLPYSSYSAWTNSNRSVAVATDNNVCVKSRKS